MKLKYFCLECKKNIITGEALVVDDTCPGTFCSEECIEEFYSNQINDFEMQETIFREKNNLVEYADQEALHEMLDDIFESPDEVVHHANDLGHSYFIYKKKVQYLADDWTAIVIALHADDTPSIVLFKTLTQEPLIIEHFMMSLKKETINTEKEETTIASKDEVKLPKELMDWVEQKKSSILAEHLIEREDDDISFEEFIDYESFLMPTLNEPDEIYIFKDEEGDDLYAYIKAFEQEDTSFYYFAICALPEWEEKPDDLDDMKVFIPVLTFPSTDGNIYRKYSSGKKFSGKLKN